MPDIHVGFQINKANSWQDRVSAGTWMKRSENNCINLKKNTNRCKSNQYVLDASHTLIWLWCCFNVQHQRWQLCLRPRYKNVVPVRTRATACWSPIWQGLATAQPYIMPYRIQPARLDIYKQYFKWLNLHSVGGGHAYLQRTTHASSHFI